MDIPAKDEIKPRAVIAKPVKLTLPILQEIGKMTGYQVRPERISQIPCFSSPLLNSRVCNPEVTDAAPKVCAITHACAIYHASRLIEGFNDEHKAHLESLSYPELLSLIERLSKPAANQVLPPPSTPKLFVPAKEPVDHPVSAAPRIDSPSPDTATVSSSLLGVAPPAAASLPVESLPIEVASPETIAIPTLANAVPPTTNEMTPMDTNPASSDSTTAVPATTPDNYPAPPPLPPAAPAAADGAEGGKVKKEKKEKKPKPANPASDSLVDKIAWVYDLAPTSVGYRAVSMLAALKTATLETICKSSGLRDGIFVHKKLFPLLDALEASGAITSTSTGEGTAAVKTYTFATCEPAEFTPIAVKAPRAPKEPKAAKTPRAPKAPKDPNAPPGAKVEKPEGLQAHEIEGYRQGSLAFTVLQILKDPASKISRNDLLAMVKERGFTAEIRFNSVIGDLSAAKGLIELSGGMINSTKVMASVPVVRAPKEPKAEAAPAADAAPAVATA
jgi:hypothetical protein